MAKEAWSYGASTSSNVVIKYEEEEEEEVNVKYESEDPLEAVEYEDYEEYPEEIKVEPELDYMGQDEEAIEDPDDENCEFVITELGTDLSELRPISRPKRWMLHEPQTPYNFRCPTCGRTFLHKRAYDQHVVVHDRKTEVTTCEICHKELKKAAIDYHMSHVHSDDKRYPCKICPKKYKSHGGLAHHMSTIHPEEPYDCDQCTQKFATFSHLQRHKCREHPRKAIKIEHINCPYCNKPFANTGQLTLHIGILGRKLGKCRDTL